MKRLTLAFLALLVACETTWQSPSQIKPLTYAVGPDVPARSVGRLRKLLLVPPLVELTGCGEPPESRAEVGKGVQSIVTNILENQKGYEITIYEDPAEIVRGPRASDALIRGLVAHQEDNADREVPQALRIEIQQLAAAYGVDGVVAIHFGPHCGGSPLTAFFDLVMIMKKNSSLGIFSGGNGSLAWMHHETLFTTAASGGWRSVAGKAGRLLWDIERAMPASLTR